MTKELVLGIVFTVIVGGLVLRTLWMWFSGQPLTPPSDPNMYDLWHSDGSSE